VDLKVPQEPKDLPERQELKVFKGLQELLALKVFKAPQEPPVRKVRLD
jgi:hypothetical protein